MHKEITVLFCNNQLSLFRPPTFKQSTPSSRTNMRQLLWREQCMENERRRSSQQQLAEEGAVAIPSVSVSHVDQAARVQDIPIQVYNECTVSSIQSHGGLEGERSVHIFTIIITVKTLPCQVFLTGQYYLGVLFLD